jgi:hypothetical protein
MWVVSVEKAPVALQAVGESTKIVSSAQFDSALVGRMNRDQMKTKLPSCWAHGA